MKTATFPTLRVDPELRQAAEDVLLQGESLSGFVERSIRESVERRQTQREFVARGLLAREEAARSGRYIASEDVVRGLEKRLEQAKSKAARSKAPKARA